MNNSSTNCAVILGMLWTAIVTSCIWGLCTIGIKVYFAVPLVILAAIGIVIFVLWVAHNLT